MSESLISLRKAKGFTQQELGEQLAKLLKQRMGVTYAQKKIARFEAGAAQPTDAELDVLARILHVKTDVLRKVVSRAPQQAMQVITDLASKGRSLIATCMMARPRPEALDESYAAAKDAIENKDFSMALFIPYPGTVNLPTASFHHVNNLVGYYTRVINDVLASSVAFMNVLTKRTNAVVIYMPKPELLRTSAILIPPILRQYSLTLHQAQPPKGPIAKSLAVWTPGNNVDTARPIKATGTYTLHDQVDAWQSFFGQIVPHWIQTNQFLEEDDYWKQVQIR